MSPSKITRTVTLMTLAISLAGVATAQTVIRPPVPPTPVVAPMPMPAPMPRLVTVPDIALPPMTIDLGEIQTNVSQALVNAKIARDAVALIDFEGMRHDLESMKWDFNHDLQQSFSYSTSGDGDYSAAKDLLYRRQYEQAIVRFDRVIAKKGANVDGSLYWKAYAQFKLGKTDDSIATISQLRKDHAQSRYLSDAKALEADARRRAGQPVNPADFDDEEMKVLAIQGIQNTDPERAIPLIEGVLNSTNSLRLKRQALYVLAQSTQPRAYQILLNYAKGAGNPDLQLEAIRYLTANRNKQTNIKDLMDIYQTTQDTPVKLAIISALRSTQNSTALSQIVRSGDSTPIVLRTSALNGLTGILSPQDLWTLYEKETNKELRLQMVSAFGSMQAVDQLTRVIKTEKDPDVRARALRALGNMKSDKSGQMLVDLYGSEQDVTAKKSIISSLANQGNAEGLVAIARKEPTLPLKTEIVRKLSEMAPRSKVAADYLMEIIK
jgi:HEAT repeat protein